MQAKKTAITTKAPIKKKSNNAARLGLPAVIKMTLAQWLAIPDAPVQRDTAKHWRKAKEYLSVLREAHYTVHMAVTKAGKKYKLDSHTRCYGWARGLTDAVPDYVTVIVHYVDDEDDVAAEYYTFDDPKQAKDAADQLYSAFKQHNITYNSSFLKNCRGIVAAMKEAIWEVSKLYEIPNAPPNLRKISVSACVDFFQNQLRALDAINPTWSKFSGPPTAAFLLAHFKYSQLDKHVDDVVECFKRHQNDAGVKDGKTHDPVYAITKIMAKRGGGGASHRLARLAKLLGCVERFVGPGGRKANWQNGASVDMDNYLLEEYALRTKKTSTPNNKNITR